MGTCAAILKINPGDKQVKLSVGRQSITLPEELTEELSKLIATVPPLSVEHIEHLKDAWGVT